MNTQAFARELLTRSVVAVPPLARSADLSVNRPENLKIIRHIESGGVSILLYGGNANFYHVSLKEYAGLLEFFCEAADGETLVIPSLGPAFGTMLDQVQILRRFDFPTAMVLPERNVATPQGVQTGLRRVVEAYGKPVILYLKDESFLPVDAVARLVSDGLISAIKYAIAQDDPLDDDYLRSLVGKVNPQWILSGIGEQPAIVHLRDFGLAGFTSGCVTIAPKLSLDMLRAAQHEDYDTAESIRRLFKPLEDLRNRIHPIRVLHDAVTLVGIADAGPMLPLLDNLRESERQQVKEVAVALLEKNQS